MKEKCFVVFMVLCCLASCASDFATRKFKRNQEVYGKDITHYTYVKRIPTGDSAAPFRDSIYCRTVVHEPKRSSSKRVSKKQNKKDRAKRLKANSKQK